MPLSTTYFVQVRGGSPRRFQTGGDTVPGWRVPARPAVLLPSADDGHHFDLVAAIPERLPEVTVCCAPGTRGRSTPLQAACRNTSRGDSAAEYRGTAASKSPMYAPGDPDPASRTPAGLAHDRYLPGASLLGRAETRPGESIVRSRISIGGCGPTSRLL